jgi:ribosomal protein S18 acetylase RimI-like enzyme
MMIVNLRPMTPEEFVPYEDADAHHYADNMVKAGFWSSEGAFNKAKNIHANLLPEGVQTKDHLFFVIEDAQTRDSIGVIWLFIDREAQLPSGFIYDLLLHEQCRGRGLGKQAMLALEQKAKELGLASVSLNVFEDNTVAKALYNSLGYEVQSLNMRKVLLTEKEEAA